jgi:hypothetical protein
MSGHVPAAFAASATDACACIHIGQCDPIGGSSVWASAQPIPPGTTRGTVVVSAAMDASALFHPLAMGAAADTSGVIALLVAAEVRFHIHMCWRERVRDRQTDRERDQGRESGVCVAAQPQVPPE